MRKGKKPVDTAVVAINFNTDSYASYRIGVPQAGSYVELINTDASEFGGSGMHLNCEPVQSEEIPCHGQEQSISIKLPPMGGAIFKCKSKNSKKS